jgi:hypothetical protein
MLLALVNAFVGRWWVLSAASAGHRRAGIRARWLRMREMRPVAH